MFYPRKRIIQDGKANLISMGRALIADPHLPNKAKAGRFEEIVPCISCNKCIQTLRKDFVRCSVNPEAGNEARFRFASAEQPRQVWIVGGGPGGLKSAEIAAARGHDVTLFEKKNLLGGRVRIGSIPPKKAVLNEFIDYLEGRARTLGANFQLGKEFTEDMVDAGNPDVLIVATGASPQFPDIKGIQESGALNVDETISNGDKIGESVLVIGGGGTGAEIADLLSEKGKKVTIVEMLDSIASDLVGHLQHFLFKRLQEKQVTILTKTHVQEIGKNYAIIEDSSGTRRLEGFDTIVMAIGGESPNNSVYEKLKGKVGELYLIGDAAQPREIIDAVLEGGEIAGKI